MTTPIDYEISDRFYEFFRDFTDEDGKRKYADQINRMTLEQKRSLLVNYDDLVLHDPYLARELRKDPEFVIAQATEALTQYIRTIDEEYLAAITENKDRLYVRFYGLPETLKLRDLRAAHVGKLIQVTGIVVRTTEIKPFLIEAHFECMHCGDIMVIEQENGVYNPPYQCANPNCNNKKDFRLLIQESKMIDWQTITIQERPEDLQPGASPRSMKCRLLDDIVDIARPGDRITLVAIVKTKSTDNLRRGARVTFDPWLDAVSIHSSSQEIETLELTEEEEREFREFAKNPYVHQRVMKAIAPMIHGLETEKEAIMLFLFGGVDKPITEGVKLRGQPNILLVGDPGVAKCVAPNTKVLLPDGRKIEIQQLVEKQLKNNIHIIDDGFYAEGSINILTMNHQGKIIPSNAIRFWKRTAPKVMYKITTTNGKTVIVTPTHPFFTLKQFLVVPTPAEKIKIGEKIAVITASGKESIRQNNQGLVTAIKTTYELKWENISSIKKIRPKFKWVYDLEVRETHNFVANDFVIHNSQLLRYTQRLAPRGIYTSGKGSSAAGLCVSGESIIMTNKGPKKIKEIVEQEFSSGGLIIKQNSEIEYKDTKGIKTIHSSNLFLKEAEIEKVWKIHAPSYLIKITSKSNKNIILTPETSLLTLDPQHGLAWRTAETIRPGDKVAIRNESQKTTSISTEDLEKIHQIMTFYSLELTAHDPENIIKEIAKKTIHWKHHEERLDPEKFEKISNILLSNYGIELIKELLNRSRYETIQLFEKRSIPPFLSMEEIITITELIKTHADSEIIDYLKSIFLRVFEEDMKHKETLTSLLIKHSNDITWDLVENVEELPSKEKYVYDLTIPESHNFIVNDFVVHNTAAVIRDPDTGELTLEAGAIVLADRGIACLAGDNTIVLDGKITEIKDVFDEKIKYSALSNKETVEINNFTKKHLPIGINYSLGIGELESTKIRRKKFKGKLLEVTLESGFKLKLTPDHKLISAENMQWKEAQKFKAGEKILAPLLIPSNHKQKTLQLHEVLSNEWKAVLKRKQVIAENNTISEKINNIPAKAQTTPLLEISSIKNIRTSINRIRTNQVIERYINIKSKEMIFENELSPEIMLLLGLNISRNRNKIRKSKNIEFPNIVPSEITTYLLSKIQKIDYEQEDKVASFQNLNDLMKSQFLKDLTNYFTANNMQNLLQLNEKQIEELFKGIILGASLFYLPEKLEIIGEFTEKEAKSLAYALRKISIYSKIKPNKRGNYDLVIPVNIEQLFSKRLKIDYNLAGEILKLSKQQTKAIINKNKLAIPNTIAEKIVSIREIKYNDYVYDLYVPVTHNFMAEGVIVHNCIDEFDKMNETDRTAIHEAMEQHSYHPSTEITLANQEKVKIGDFVDTLFEKYHERKIEGINCEILPVSDLPLYLLSTDFSKNIPVKINRVSRHQAPEYFVHITYDNGSKITVTEEHPVFVYKDGEIKTIPAIKLKIGDYSPVPRKIQVHNKFSLLDLDLGDLIINSEKEKQRIPPNIFSLPEKDKIQYLKRLYGEYGKKDPQPSLIIQNEEFASDIKELLLTLGIPSIIKWKPNKGFELKIHATLKELILIEDNQNSSKNKIQRQTALPVSKKLPPPIKKYIEKLPPSYSKEILEIISESQEDFSAPKLENIIIERLNSITSLSSVNSNSNQLLQVTSIINPEKIASDLVKLLFFNWSKIINIKIIPNAGKYSCKWVYDVTIEPYQNFYSNSLLLHNTVSIAKAGIVATLNARTGILAAANPRFGRYDRQKSPVENINLSPTIISRFDLIFIIEDIPNEELDRKRARHILELHRSGIPSEAEADITPEFLKKYILYAKEHCHPVLSKEAAQEIEDFYVGMRALGKESKDGIVRIPITARQLEGIIRLAEARARVALRDQVTKDDAKAAIELVKASLRQVGWDEEAKQFDVDLITTGISARQRSDAEKILQIVDELSGPKKEKVDIEKIVKTAEEKYKLNPDLVRSLIQRYVRDGLLYQPEHGKVKKP